MNQMGGVAGGISAIVDHRFPFPCGWRNTIGAMGIGGMALIAVGQTGQSGLSLCPVKAGRRAVAMFTLRVGRVGVELGGEVASMSAA